MHFFLAALRINYYILVKLLTEHNLESLSLNGGCTDLSVSTLVKMPHIWKSHVTFILFVPVCEACTDAIYIEECVSSIGVSQSSLEEHLNLIQNGYCFCEDEDIESKNKVNVNQVDLHRRHCVVSLSKIL